jgi:hypothetical protein
MGFAKYTKAIVAVVLPLLGLAGVELSEAELSTTVATITSLVTALVVFFAPNK